MGDFTKFDTLGIIESLPICEPPKVQKIRKQTMTSLEGLKHTKWECEYHIIWIPKYRKKRTSEWADSIYLYWLRLD